MKDTIKVWRVRKGLTQEQLAKKMGVSAPTIHYWENGTTMPSGKNLQMLASVFGISADDIILP